MHNNNNNNIICDLDENKDDKTPLYNNKQLVEQNSNITNHDNNIKYMNTS
jgi:hypothetical protein